VAVGHEVVEEEEQGLVRPRNDNSQNGGMQYKFLLVRLTPAPGPSIGGVGSQRMLELPEDGGRKG